MSESEEERNTPILNIEIIRKNISNFERNLGNLYLDGIGFAFTSLNLENRELEQLCEELALYKHLRNLNLSSNKLVKIELLKRLPSLLHLQLQHNNILNWTSSKTRKLFLTYKLLILASIASKSSTQSNVHVL